MQKSIPTTFIYTALACEAKPLIAHFKLKKDLESRAFEMYFNGDICLTVTGIGKSAMAAGVAYAQARTGLPQQPILLNVGIAGHADCGIGDALIAGKIVDADTKRQHFPPIVYTPPCAVAALRTFSRPHLEYTDAGFYDMEASAFYETAIRFTSAEFVQALKVVSDNRGHSALQLLPKQVSELISAQLPAVTALLAELRVLQALIRVDDPKHYEELTGRVRLTVSEKQQLRAELQRWHCLTDGRPLAVETFGCHSGKALLSWLAGQIDALAVTL